MPEIAIIGDEEIMQFSPGAAPLSWNSAQTPFGPASYIYSGRVKFKNALGANSGVDVILVRRDKANDAAGTDPNNYGYPSTYGEERIPSEVPYRANMYVLKKLGVKYIFSIAQMGRLKENIQVNDIYLPDQFIDYTRNRGNLLYDDQFTNTNGVYDPTHPYYYLWLLMRKMNHRGDTFFGGGAVAHVSMVQPVCPALGYLLDGAFRKVKDSLVNRYKTDEKPNVFSSGVSASIEGPQLPTFGEVTAYKLAGCSVCSMTDMPEAKLAREAEIAYATLGLVTEEDCGIPYPLGDTWAQKMEERAKIRAINFWNAKIILTEAVKRCSQLKPDSIAHKALDRGLRTPVSSMSASARARLGPILQRFGGTITNPITVPPVPATNVSITIDIFGDSIARGYGLNFSLSTFAKILEPTWSVNNISANGVTLKAIQLGYTTSYPGAPPSESPLGPQPPFANVVRTGKYTVIEAGLNDAMGITNPQDVITAAEFETRLRAMVAIVQSEGRVPVLTGIPGVHWESSIFTNGLGNTTVRDRVIAFNNVCRTVATSTNSLFADFNSVYTGPNDTFDGIHPVQVASNKMTTKMIEVIKKHAGI